jgi:hypothetical protein
MEAMCDKREVLHASIVMRCWERLVGALSGVRLQLGAAA